MQHSFLFSNLSTAIAVLYILIYALTLVLFFIVIKKETRFLSNFSSIFLHLNYNKKRYHTAIVTFISFLGIPPLLAFAPKFAAMGSIFNKSGAIFFAIAMLSIFCSFSLYLQVMDVLFDKNLSSRSIFKIIKEQQKPSRKFYINAYADSVIITTCLFFLIFGVFFFKDILCIIYVCL